MELQTLVKETTTTQGTGTLNIDGAASNFRSFAAAFPGVTAGSGSAIVPYEIRAGAVFEEGQGTFSITGGGQDQLARDTVWASSNSGSLVDLGVGPKDVYLVIPATQVLFKDATNVVGVAASVLTLKGANGALKFDEAGQGIGVAWHAGQNGASVLTLATKGELNLPNGWKVKTNTVAVTAATGTVTDTFATAFPTAFRGALVCWKGARDTSAPSGFVSYEPDALTGIKLHNGDTADWDISYMAWGD